MPHLIIYHKNCTDGFTAAWIAHRALGGGELLPANYGDAPPDVRDRDVVIVDFSYPRDTLIRMKEQAASLRVLDHHQSAREALAGLDFCVFDMEECGASLTWRHFHGDAPMPRLVHYVKDRDLWRWKEHWSQEVSAYIGSLDHGIDAWDRLREEVSNHRVLDAVAAGRAILRSQHREIVRMAKDATRIVLEGIPLLAANAPVLISETGDHLAGQSASGVAGLWHVKGTKVYWSLRSDGRVDVAALAQKFGGGGHPKASGFTVPIDTHLRLMGWSS